MDRACALAAAARDLLGAPFRLQGRNPQTGLDCVGLVLSSLETIGVCLSLPADYRPHRRDIDIPRGPLARAGLLVGAGPVRPGDVVLLRTGPSQVHIAIGDDRPNIIHAHATLGRVVRGPLPDQWAILELWRFESAPAPATPDQGDPEWLR